MLCIFSSFSHSTPVTDSFYQFSTKEFSKSLIQHKMSSKFCFLITVKPLTTIQKSLRSLTFCRPGLHKEACSSGGSYPPLVKGSTERGRQTACVLLSHYFSNCFPWLLAPIDLFWFQESLLSSSKDAVQHRMVQQAAPATLC